MTSVAKRDLESLVDDNPVGGFQVAILMLCALVAMLDGFDTQAIAFVAPEILASWHVPAASFGPVFGAGLLGGLVGAMIFGVVGDRFGRKPALLVSVSLFAVVSLLTPLATTLPALCAMRLLTGLGLGGALPSFIALSSEFSPRRVRPTLVGLMFCGFPIGAVIGGVASSRLIPAFGWPSVFIVGGVLPLVILPVFMAIVPESVRFLALRRREADIARILRRMGCAAGWNGQLTAQAGESKAPIASLFRDGRAPGTFLLWATLFLSLLLTYFLVNWIPVVARQSGLPIGSSVIAVAMLNLGAVVGCLLIGRLSQRFGVARMIGWGYGLGALAIAAISQAGASPVTLCAITFLAGALSIGAQMCTVVLCANFYDTAVRATGVGWSMGVGRVGAIAGPVLGGMLLAAGTSVPTLFVVVGLTSLGAAVAVFALGRFALDPERLSRMGGLAPAHSAAVH